MYNSFLPGKIYYVGSLLLLGGYDEPRVLDAEVANAQEAAELTYSLDPDAWVYIELPRRKPKRRKHL